MRVPLDVIKAEKCIPLRECGDIEGRIVVIRDSVLRPEYRIPTEQIQMAVGGNGTKENARGQSVFCVNVYSGEHTRYNRHDVIGVLKPECYPDWLKDKLEKNSEIQKHKKDKEPER